MTIADLAIIAGLVFAWGTLSARLERFGMTAPIMFTVAGVLLTHGRLTPLGITLSKEVVKVLAEVTLVLVLFSDASRTGLHYLRADLGLCLRLLRIGLPLTIGLGTLAAFTLPGVSNIWARPARRRGARADRCRARCGRDGQPRGSGQDPLADQRRERAQRRDRHPVRAGRDRRRGDCRACRQRRGRAAGLLSDATTARRPASRP